MPGRAPAQFRFSARQGSGDWIDPVSNDSQTVEHDDTTWKKLTYYLHEETLENLGDAGRSFEGAFYVVDTDTDKSLFSKSVRFRLPGRQSRDDDRDWGRRRGRARGW